MSITGKKVVIVGGSSGIGLSTAKLAIAQGAEVKIGSRSADKLNSAKTDLGNSVDTFEIDVSRDESVASAFATIGKCDHVVCTAPGATVGAVKELDIQAAQNGLNAKFWGCVRVAKYSDIDSSGSLTFLSGQMARRPIKNLLAGAAANAAVDVLARGLAAELAPVRVNSVSPGFIDTALHSRLPKEELERRIEEAKKTLPVGRVGHPDDIGMMIIHIMQNGFLTGAVVEVDGGRAVL